MIFNEHKRIYNEIDEIDHLTLQRRKGGVFSALHAARLIRRYRALDADVAAALALSDEAAAQERLAAADQQTLYDLLVKTRTVLMQKTPLGTKQEIRRSAVSGQPAAFPAGTDPKGAETHS